MIAERYSLDREIGRGGTSAVWLGRDELLGRRVALKRIGLLPGADHTDAARAEREARLSARLNHPHVVAVFDVVTEAETGDRWLVMEYVEGRTLDQLVRERGRLSPDTAGPLLWQVADGLAAAHAEGITHRDVKPSNILLDDDGHAKITDFGIARVVSDVSLTQTGLVTGSPAYLAPEIASGGRGEPPSDVWSLGATAFHVLAGRPPYEIGDHVLGALYRIVNDEPPRLPDAGWMAPLLEATLVKDPALRWTMEEVREFLARPDRTVLPTPAPALAVAAGRHDGEHTRLLGTLAPTPAAPAVPPPAPAVGPPRTVLLAVGAVAALVLGVLLISGLIRNDPDATRTGTSALPKGATTGVATKPTAAGIEQFIRDYVTTVADDPDRAWTMLSPKFQQESGGLERYRRFWDSASDGRVLGITADPDNLSVSYRVHFDHFDNGPGPTVLDLTYADGRYLIDGERTKGFVPAASD